MIDVTDFVPAAIGFAAGLLVGVTSTGGGALLTPALLLIARVPPTVAIGSGAVIASGMKLVGGGYHALLAVAALGHASAGRVDVGLAAAGLAGALPGVLIGARLATSVPEGALRAALAVVLVAIGLPLAAFDV